MKEGSRYRLLFDALPESGAGPIEWSCAECQRIQTALRRSGVFKQTWFRAAAFRMLDERRRRLRDGGEEGAALPPKGFQ
ncbi:MAG TPA: hypothetical protein VD886_21640 [Herpetosiphonaceae bacterium]|nr:hypothetical protein [Herpetosiphonaceae bacterium]